MSTFESSLSHETWQNSHFSSSSETSNQDASDALWKPNSSTGTPTGRYPARFQDSPRVTAERGASGTEHQRQESQEVFQDPGQSLCVPPQISNYKSGQIQWPMEVYTQTQALPLSMMHPPPSTHFNYGFGGLSHFLPCQVYPQFNEAPHNAFNEFPMDEMMYHSNISNFALGQGMLNDIRRRGSTKPQQQKQNSVEQGKDEYEDKDKIPRRYMCSICSKRFTRPSTLKTHMNSHTGERPYACTMAGCEWKFTVLSNLKRHMKICCKNQPAGK